MPRGRPPKVEIQKIIEIVLMHKDEIIHDEKSHDLVPETHSVWKIMSAKLLHGIKPSSLYSYVVNNRFSLKNLLFGETESNSVKNNDTTTSTVEETESPIKKIDLGFILTFTKNEFDDLVMETQRRTKDKKGGTKLRIVNILKPQKWTDIVSKKSV